MSTNHTTNYNLCQWEATDQVQRTDFNQDNAKIDAALAEHAAKIAQKGNCKIEYGSYVGTGNRGPNSPSTLTFSGKPLLVIVADTTNGSFMLMMRSSIFGLYVLGGNESIGMPYLDWETECAVSWYTGSQVSDYQVNTAGRKYVYIALIAVGA